MGQGLRANLADDGANSRVGDGNGDLHALLRGRHGAPGHGRAEGAHARRHVAAAHGRRVAVAHREGREPAGICIGGQDWRGWN